MNALRRNALRQAGSTASRSARVDGLVRAAAIETHRPAAVHTVCNIDTFRRMLAAISLQAKLSLQVR